MVWVRWYELDFATVCPKQTAIRKSGLLDIRVPEMPLGKSGNGLYEY